MVQYKFEGDVDNISERQQEFINNVIIEMGFENSRVSDKPVGKAGDNYAASVKRITIEGEHATLTMIAKIAPKFENIQMSINTAMLFMNEHIMYTEVLPKLVQFQKEADVPEVEQLRYAKCYGTFLELGNEVILLEDLQTSKFTMLDRFAPLSSECVKSVLKNFALLHSLSYVLRHKEPETFNKYKADLKNIWSVMAEDESLNKVFQALEDDTFAIVEDPKHKNFVRHNIANSLLKLTNLSKANFDSEYTIIQQGDPWTNNIMFRFEGDKLSNSVMIDYQLSRNTSPVCDIMYMIFSSTDHNTRSQNYYDWIDFYHSELDKSLANFNLKANVVYPRDVLDAELKEYGKSLFGLAVFLASIMVRKTSDAEKMKEVIKNIYDNDATEMAQEMSLSSSDEESKTLFKNRIVGLIDSFTEFGLM